MKIYIIKSGYHDEILGEVRTDGTNLDWTVDNTNGQLPKSAPTLERLKQICSKSSHMHMEDPGDQKVGLLRYTLQNGDIVEITSDGKSATLNGKMLDEAHKKALLTAISNGGIKVAHRADTRQSIPILPEVRTRKPVEGKPEINKEFVKAAIANNEKAKQSAKRDNSTHDSRIEKMDFGKEDPEMGKSMMYFLKYGVGKGESSND